MIQYSWPVSLSPGNEQSFRWGSDAAVTEGSFNYPGVKSAAVDAMIERVAQGRGPRPLRLGDARAGSRAALRRLRHSAVSSAAPVGRALEQFEAPRDEPRFTAIRSTLGGSSRAVKADGPGHDAPRRSDRKDRTRAAPSPPTVCCDVARARDPARPRFAIRPTWRRSASDRRKTCPIELPMPPSMRSPRS